MQWLTHLISELLQNPQGQDEFPQEYVLHYKWLYEYATWKEKKII